MSVVNTLYLPMAFCDISLSRESVRLDDDPTFSVQLTRELRDLRKISLSLLMAFLTVHVVSASHAFAATTLALLVYTMNLHIVVNTRFFQSSLALSRFLHAIPLLGIFCMAILKLVIVVQSPAVAAAVLLACALPPLIITVHLVKRYAGTVLMPFPVQMQDAVPAVPAPTAPSQKGGQVNGDFAMSSRSRK